MGSFNVHEFVKRLKARGIDVENFSAWNKLKEFQLVSNVVKHAEGGATTKLKKLRPDMFSPPNLDEQVLAYSDHQVFQPLFGQDFYVTVKETQSYFQAVEDFWGELVIHLNNP